ncbi:hypothetical protein DFH08DRAFT_828411 [Mycena albidolilacea]|uniref:Uncharacterized protein n=1 Tax=Mycena albidolilacea TaxID=1033008 RepID=A0AAD7E6E9_9AGAR|nr:hypothetical protein DFH08DRAFT_828411 [Mycena albidolilacea]
MRTQVLFAAHGNSGADELFMNFTRLSTHVSYILMSFGLTASNLTRLIFQGVLYQAAWNELEDFFFATCCYVLCTQVPVLPGLRKRMERKLKDCLEESGVEIAELMQIEWLDKECNPVKYKRRTGNHCGSGEAVTRNPRAKRATASPTMTTRINSRTCTLVVLEDDGNYELSQLSFTISYIGRNVPFEMYKAPKIKSTHS